MNEDLPGATDVHPLVLIATDGSNIALNAATGALAVFGDRADYVLLAVIDAIADPDADAGGFEGPVLSETEAIEDHREAVVEAEGALAQSARVFGPNPVRHLTVEKDEGSVGAKICASAIELGAEVVVVGSHGRHAITDLVLGSVSNYVVHHASCPVLVIRAAPKAS